MCADAKSGIVRTIYQSLTVLLPTFDWLVRNVVDFGLVGNGFFISTRARDLNATQLVPTSLSVRVLKVKITFIKKNEFH